jgi:hypothetical protein
MRLDVRLYRGWWDLVLQTDDLEILCHLRVREDSINSWLCGLIKSMDREPNIECLQRLSDVAEQLAVVNHDERTRQSFFRFLHAFYIFLGSEQSSRLSGRSQSRKVLKNILDDLFQVRAEREDGYVRYGIGGIFDLREAIPPDMLVTHIPVALWRKALHGHCDLTSLQIILGKFNELERSTLRIQDDFEGRSYLSFCQALVEVIEPDERFTSYTQTLLDVCESIASNRYGDVDDKRPYLERILNDENARIVRKRLDRIIDNVKAQCEQTGDASSGRLETLVGLMSDHYLRNYDLDQVVALWRKTGRVKLWMRTNDQKTGSDELLSFFMRLFDRPHYQLALISALFAILAGFAHINTHLYVWARPLFPLVPLIMSALVSLLTIAVIGGSFYLVLKRIYYLQLLLPRLWGAIIVGLVVLLMDDLPWRMGLHIHLPAWLALGSGAYFLSYAYIFLDVYRVIRLRPPVKGGSTVSHAAYVSGKIWAIGILEALLAVFFTTTLIFPTIGLQESSGLPTQDLIGGIACLKSLGDSCWIEFGFFPGLVLLWTGLTLFVGAFVQLLWQNRRITEAV